MGDGISDNRSCDHRQHDAVALRAERDALRSALAAVPSEVGYLVGLERERDQLRARLEEFSGKVMTQGAHIAAVEDERDALRARVAELEAFARDVRDNWDCDSDGHRYDTGCRCCKAGKVLEARKERG